MKKSLLSIVGLMFSIVAFAVDGNLRKQGNWEHHYSFFEGKLFRYYNIKMNHEKEIFTLYGPINTIILC